MTKRCPRAWFGLVFLVALMIAAYLPASIVTAAPSSTVAGISLSPFEQAISLQPDQTNRSFNLTLTNHTSALQELDLSTHDFGSLNDTGGVLLEGSNSYTQRYGLASWLSLSSDTVILPPGASQSVVVTVANRSDLQPGGHYGAIVASVNSLNDQSGNHVVINQQLLSLVLVDKVGGEHYDLHLDSISQNGNWLHLPNTVELRFQNPGNVHVIPRGLVKLEDPGGRVSAQGVINEASAFILPDSFYDMYVPLSPVGHARSWPGAYRVVVDYRYDGISRYATKTALVKFVDLKVYAVIILVLVALWWLARRWRVRRQPPPAASPAEKPVKAAAKKPAVGSRKKAPKTS